MQENTSVTKMMKIDLKEEAYFNPAVKMNLGHSAEAILKKSTMVDASEARNLRQGARGFLVALVEKITDKYPLKHRVNKYISSSSPTQIANSRKNCLHFSSTSYVRILLNASSSVVNLQTKLKVLITSL